MTRERGLTLTLDQLTRIDPLRTAPHPQAPPHPNPVVQCYCAYACHVNSRIRATELHTGWIAPVGMQFHDRSTRSSAHALIPRSTRLPIKYRPAISRDYRGSQMEREPGGAEF